MYKKIFSFVFFFFLLNVTITKADILEVPCEPNSSGKYVYVIKYHWGESWDKDYSYTLTSSSPVTFTLDPYDNILGLFAKTESDFSFGSWNYPSGYHKLFVIDEARGDYLISINDISYNEMIKPSRPNSSFVDNEPIIHISSPKDGATYNKPNRDEWEPYSFIIQVKYRFSPVGWNNDKTLSDKILSGFTGYNPIYSNKGCGFEVTPVSNKITREPKGLFISPEEWYWEGVASLRITVRTSGSIYLGIVNKWFESIDHSDYFPDVRPRFRDFITVTITDDPLADEGFSDVGDIDKPKDPVDDLEGSGFPNLPSDAGIGDYFNWFFEVITWLITFPLKKMYEAFTVCTSYITKMVNILSETSIAMTSLITFIPSDILGVVNGVLAFSVCFSVVLFILKLIRK